MIKNHINENKIFEKLVKVTGLQIIRKYKFGWLNTNPAQNEKVNKIFDAICKERSKKDFIKNEILTIGNDFYLPKPYNCLFEFDEYQHFSQLRKLALENYNNIDVFFNHIKGVEGYLNDPNIKFNRHDNSPEYRDEQRAYYDSLRDILPLYNGLNPTIRLSKHIVENLLEYEIENLIGKILNEYKPTFNIRI